MALSRLMLVTQSSIMQPHFCSALEAALTGGARLIQLREKELSCAQTLRLAQAAKALCDSFHARLVINGDGETAQAIGTGIHLRESQSATKARDALGSGYSIGQSVHSLEAAWRAQNEGCDYLVFGSVFPTASHPGSTPGGLEALRNVTREISIPVFAIGGITPENARQCLDCGAHGVGVIRAIWSAPDITEATRRLLEVLEV